MVELFLAAKFAKHNQLNDFVYKLYKHLENENSPVSTA